MVSRCSSNRSRKALTAMECKGNRKEAAELSRMNANNTPRVSIHVMIPALCAPNFTIVITMRE